MINRNMSELQDSKRTGAKKRVSKRTKRSWRKHTDVKDVEEHLEDIRQEERTGGFLSKKLPKNQCYSFATYFLIDRGLIAEKKDDILFFVDKDRKEPLITTKEKTQDEDFSSDEERYVSRKEKISRRLKKEQEQEKADREKNKFCPKMDVWSKPEKVEVEDPFVSDNLPKKPKKPTTVGERVSKLPAVEVDEGGQSYNPEFEDHQSLLSKAHAIEVDKFTRVEKLEKKVKYLTKEEIESKPSWIEEMSEGLTGEVKTAVELDNVEDEEEITVSAASAKERKSRKRKRKELEEKEKQRNRVKEKETKKRLNDVYRIKTIQREIKEVEAEKAKKEEEKKRKEESEACNPKRLGKYKYEDSSIPLKLSDELVGTLRELKPEGNLLEDRFKSLQKRNIIEPRKPVLPHRKYKIKEYEKRSYKKPTIKELGEET